MNAKLLLVPLVLAGLLPSPTVAGEAGAAAAAGLSLSALTDDYLEAVRQATGYRVGVLIAAVAPGTPAAAAGLRTGDLLYTVAGRTVDSPAAVDEALAGRAGAVAVTGVRPAKAGGWEALDVTLTLPPAGSGAAPPAAKGRTYRHVIGFSLWYPEGWTVASGEGYLTLVPPDPAGTPASPEELYLITGESVEGTGIASAADPRVAEFLDGQVRSMIPAFRRVRGPDPVPTAKGGGVVMEWRAEGAPGGEVAGRAYVNILRGHGVALVAIGLRKHLDAREGALRAVFASFGFGEGRLDARLAGRWGLVSTRSLSGSALEPTGSRAGMVSETQSSIELRADGTFERTDVTETIAMGAGVSLADKRRDVWRGRWNAGDGVLCLMGEDESFAEYRYDLVPGTRAPELHLTGAARVEVWSR
jgi:hypothetical protein